VAVRHLRRIFGLITSALLVLMLVGPTTTVAGQPGWQFINTKLLPPVVAPDANAGYSFTIKNGGKSTIAAVYLTTDIDQVPVYNWNQRGVVCQTSPKLLCALGSLAPQGTIDVKVAYDTEGFTDNFDVTFLLNGTGNTDSDLGDTSHGDSKPQFFSTQILDNDNFDGGFNLNDTNVGTTGALGRGNVQTTAIDPPAGSNAIVVTAEDGLPDNTVTCPGGTAGCSHRFGEWSHIVVDNGNPTTGFKTVLTVYGVPGQATEDNIYVLKVNEAKTVITPISQDCSYPSPGATPTNMDCITVTKLGGNIFQIILWTIQNGYGRGTY